MDGEESYFSMGEGIPDSKVHGSNMGPTWGRQDRGGPHVAPWTLLSGMAYGGLPFLHTGGPVPDIYIYHVSDMINVWDTVSTFNHPPWMFLLMNILFWTMDWIIYNGPPLYRIYILNLG